MRIALQKGERLRIDGIVWAVDRRVPTGFQLISVGDGIFRILTDKKLTENFFAGRVERLDPSLDTNAVATLNPRDRDFTAFTAAERAEAERRCMYLEKLLQLAGRPPYSDDELRRCAQEIAKIRADAKPVPSPRTYRRWIALDQRAGADVRAQVPRYFGRGSRGPRFPESVQRIAKQTLDEYLMRPAPPPIKEVYATFVARLELENTLRPGSPLPVPSLPTFYRWAADLDDEDLIAAQRGPRAAQAKYLAVQVAPDETTPMAAVEIDHNFVDCIVVDDHGVTLGRPTLTVAIDRATRMCVGFVLTWEPPSYQCVMLVLRHMIRDKAYVREAFGDRIQHDWPCLGLPRSIVVDNGMEFHSQHLREACLQLGRISIEYAPSRSPRHKGKVERFFRTLNDQLFHLLPGTTLSRVCRESDYNPAKKATITLRDLNFLLHKYFIDIYSRSYHRGLKDVPVEVWRRKVESHPLRLPVCLKDLDILSCGITQRVIGRQGIELFSLFYYSPELTAIRIQNKGKVQVEVRYDPTDIGTIWVADPISGRHIAVPCRAPGYASGTTLWQHKRVLEHLRERRHGATERDLIRARAELRQLIEGTSGHRRSRNRSRKRSARFLETPSTPDRLALGAAVAVAPRPESAAPRLDEPQTTPSPGSQQRVSGEDVDLQEFIRKLGLNARQREW